MQNNKIILDYIKKNLGKDLNDDYNELGCAQTVNNILKNSLGYEAGGGASTAKMLDEILVNSNFKEMTTTTAEAGDIILSATGTGNGSIAHGHVGFLGESGIIYSNNSVKGVLDNHITATEWKNYFVVKGGFPVRYFRAIANPIIPVKPMTPTYTEIKTPTNYDDRKADLFEIFTKTKKVALNISATKIFMLMLASVIAYGFISGKLTQDNFMYIALSVIAFYTGNKVSKN